MWDKTIGNQFFRDRKSSVAAPPSATPGLPERQATCASAIGFSLSELDDAGINVEAAGAPGFAVDAGRIGPYGPMYRFARVRSIGAPAGQTGIIQLKS